MHEPDEEDPDLREAVPGAAPAGPKRPRSASPLPERRTRPRGEDDAEQLFVFADYLGLLTPSTSSRRKEYRCLFNNSDFHSEVLKSFFADGRTSSSQIFTKKKAGREILRKNITEEEWPLFEKALLEDWQQWLRLGAVTIVPPEEARLVPRDDRRLFQLKLDHSRHRNTTMLGTRTSVKYA